MNLAAILIIIITITILVFEIWAWVTRNPTITDDARKVQIRWGFFRWFVMIIMIYLWWHLFAFSFR